MKLIWDERAWEDYLYWQKTDRKILKRINRIIKETKRNPVEGIGAPEPLSYNWKGYWSRRINREHRFVYKHEDDTLLIAQCRYHY
ncbi:Txe/YoeB family addiction module toxin [Desulfococcaceae bacterium HSG9]|nr:Txe/YoeB family addiction module toxin [Desulfococcaceae bacterium HSG9]